MRILIVEDDKVFGMLIARILQPYLEDEDEIIHVQTPEELQAYIDKYGAPDLTALDLNLPGSRWDKTVKWIDSLRDKGGVVAVITGATDDGTGIIEKTCREKGADSFIRKPFTEKGFLANLRDTFQSLMSTGDRYKPYTRIMEALSRHLEKEPSIISKV